MEKNNKNQHTFLKILGGIMLFNWLTGSRKDKKKKHRRKNWLGL